MKRGAVSWLVLGACAALIAGAMGWFTAKVRELERARGIAEARADLGERTRLALWRMDAAGTAIMLAENSHPPADYQCSAIDPFAAYLPPSPFVGLDDPLTKLHFELGRNGVLRSPEADEVLGRQAGVADTRVAERKSRLVALGALLRNNHMAGGEWSALSQAAQIGESNWQAVPKDAKEADSPAQSDIGEEKAMVQKKIETLKGQRQEADYQQRFNDYERAQRARVVEQTVNMAAGVNNGAIGNLTQQGLSNNKANSQPQAEQPQAAVAPGGAGGSAAVAATDSAQFKSTDDALAQAGKQTTGRVPQAAAPSADTAPPPLETIIDLGTMRATWIGPELFLLRQLTVRKAGVADEQRIQGVWLDASALRKHLLETAEDLLAHASLVNLQPSADGVPAVQDEPLGLVSFPFRLEPGETAVAPALATNSPLERSLRVGWTAVALALLAAGLLVAGVMRLSERRAAFVSSVTHELRTPLTTFRLYSDMLVEGMVKDEIKKTGYLRTMRSEADRLHHLVENVLAYSRIERGSARTRREQVAAVDMLERMRGRFDERAKRDGLELNMEWTTAERPSIDTDVTAVEQIVFNLVDNACKYGRPNNGDRGNIRVRGGADTQRVWIEVSDKGPGVPLPEARRMFRPFHKSASEAAHSMPGVGLGLALSRRLARALGGELALCNAGRPGACFRLEIPR